MQQTIVARQAGTATLAFPKSMPVWAGRAAKLALFAATGAAVMALAYMALPTLQTAGAWGYAAGFVIQAVSAASIMIPVPGLAVLMVIAQGLDPLPLAGAGAAGAALGELTGYWLGAQGRGIAHRFSLFDRVQSQMDRRGGLIVLLFSVVPVLPMDAIGIMSGAVRYPVMRFLIATFVGRFALLLVTFLGARELVAAVL